MSQSDIITAYNIGFVGVGKLGLPCAEAMARNNLVVGYDNALRHPQNFEMADSLYQCVRGRDFVFVAVQTPHRQAYGGSQPVYDLPAMDFDYSKIIDSLLEIDACAAPGQVVVLISTVLPGTIRREVAPLMKNIELIYNPYFIAMVTVTEDFLNPPLMIFGTQHGGDDANVDRLDEFYRYTLENYGDHTNIMVGTWEEAEAVKIFYNTFITWKITFVNMIMDVSEKIGHMNVDKITTALANETQRIISPAYMTAGMGDSGPCHPRDNIALRWLSQELGLGYDLFSEIIKAREVQASHIADKAAAYDMPVVIMGKAYKVGTALQNGSYGMLMGHLLNAQGHDVYYYDKMIQCEDIPDPDQAKTYILSHPDPDFHTYDFPPGSVVLDLWRQCPSLDGRTVIHYGDTTQ